MKRYRTRGDSAQLSTAIAATLLTLGSIALFIGSIIYLRGTFAFGGRIVVLAVVAAVLVGPCLILLRVARLACNSRFVPAMQTSILCGLVMLPELAAAYLFTTFVDPCWDAPICTNPAPDFAHSAISAGLRGLAIAAFLALIVSPLLLWLAHRSTSTLVPG